MYHKDAVLCTAVYYPKRGMEDQFITLWESAICKIAYQQGATHMGLYHNEETDEFITIEHWPSKALCDQYLHSKELELQLETLTELCLIPPTREIFEVLKAAAA